MGTEPKTVSVPPADGMPHGVLDDNFMVKLAPSMAVFILSVADMLGRVYLKHPVHYAVSRSFVNRDRDICSFILQKNYMIPPPI